MSPVSVKVSTRESNSEASNESSLLLEVDDAEEVDLQIRGSATSSAGSATRSTPRIAKRRARDLEDDARARG